MRVTQSQNVPLSCLRRPLANRLAEAAYRDILGLSYVRAFSAEWITADHVSTKLATHGKPDQRQCETNKQKTCGCQGLQSSIGICIILTISFTKFRQI